METTNNLLIIFLLLVSNSFVTFSVTNKHPLANIAIHKAVIDIQESSSITAYPIDFDDKRDDILWINVEVESADPSEDDWVGVFSPAKFNGSDCYRESDLDMMNAPHICTAPIKYKFVSYPTPDYAPDYVKRRHGVLQFEIINQRADFSFALFTGGVYSPKLISVSSPLSFKTPKAPLYPHLAQGKSWDQMAVTWTSGYSIDEAIPFVEYRSAGRGRNLSHAGTVTFSRSKLCGEPAVTFGWRDPGFIHTSFLNKLWPNTMYDYRMGHRLVNKSIVWSKRYRFKSSPNPGHDSLQRVIIFGDMGKGERDGSYDMYAYQPGSLMTTDRLENDLKNYDIVFHIGNLARARGYLSQWDQFTAQIQPIASTKPYMTASGSDEQDYFNSRSTYRISDSGGECGVPAETMFYVPAKHRAKSWYSTDYGMFHFCIADSNLDLSEGSEQYAWIEKCFASVDKQKQPWLIFAANHVPGHFIDGKDVLRGRYLDEPMLKLWHKYNVDIAFYGGDHNYERSCAVYENQCVSMERDNYWGSKTGTIHVIVGGAGSQVYNNIGLDRDWLVYEDLIDFGFGKLTAFNHSLLLFEYIKSRDGLVYDSFTISRDY